MRFQFARSSGPGGQNVNKLNTKAELWVSISALRGISSDSMGRLMLLAGRRLTRQGEIHLTAEASRSQEANRQAVLDRLRELLIAAMHRPRPRRKTRPSRASRQKRLNAKKHRGKIKSGRRGLED
jgi:ribosome-associated protein